MSNTNIAAAEILEAAATVARLGGWTQNALAKDKDNVVTSTLDDAACAWCAIGLICTAASELGYEPLERLALMSFKNSNEIADIAAWNDAPHRTAKQVALAMDRAAEGLRK